MVHCTNVVGYPQKMNKNKHSKINIAANSDDEPKPWRHPGGFRETVQGGQNAFKVGKYKRTV